MQINKTFSISEAINYGWETFKKNPMFWVLITLIQMVIGGVSEVFNIESDSGQATEATVAIALIFFVFSLVYQVFVVGINMGAIRVTLDALEDKKLEYTTLFSQFQVGKLVKFIIASIIYIFFVLIGLILLIVPGIYLATKYQFYVYAIIENNAGIFESFKISSNLTKGVKLQIIGLSIISFAIIILGFLALILGLLVAIPVASLAHTYVYKKLQGISVSSAQPITQPDNLGTQVQSQIEALGN